MQYIYARVSTELQDNENQLHSLRRAFPEASIVEEVGSGCKARPVLKDLVARLNRGDVLIVNSLDRLGRKTSEVINLIEDLDKRGVVLKSIREGVDYSTVTGRLVTQILCSVAELERGLISERTKAALKAKREQGVILGRRPVFSSELVQKALTLYRQGGLTLKQTSAFSGISISRLNELVNATA